MTVLSTSNNLDISSYLAQTVFSTVLTDNLTSPFFA